MRKICVIFLVIISNYLIGQDWELKKNDDGIKVYTALQEGSDVARFKLVTQFNTTIPQLMSILLDASSATKWMTNVAECKTLSNENTHDFTHYVLEMPWPFSNRDMILKRQVVYSSDSSQATLELTSSPTYTSNKEDLVRMQIAEGSWKLTAQENNSVSVEYSFLGDPAGNIPTWVVNMFIVDGPFESAVNLREKMLK